MLSVGAAFSLARYARGASVSAGFVASIVNSLHLPSYIRVALAAIVMNKCSSP